MSAEPETIDQLIQRVAKQTGEYAEALAKTCIPIALADQLVLEFNRALLAQVAGYGGPLGVQVAPFPWAVPPASEVPK